MALAIALVLLVVISVAFHFLSPWWFTPIASNWQMIDDTVNITFWVTGIVFIAINIFMAYAVYRYRYRKDQRATYEPENKKLEWWLIGVTTVGVVAMLAPGLFVWAKFVTVPEDAAVVEAVGQQWQWTYRHPGKDGELGTVDVAHITDENPFGMNPEDPYGQDDILIYSQELHLPIDEPVKVLLRSKDVLHDFAVAQFRVKMDLVPGLVTYVWFTPTRAGRYEVLCEELCGLGHHLMRGHVVVEERSKYESWLSQYPTFQQTMVKTETDVEAGKALYTLCSTCHGPQGEGMPAMNGPKLAGQESWYLKRQLNYYKQGIRGVHEQDVFGKMMAPMAATLADEAAINNVIAYIGTFPDEHAASTVMGHVGRGEQIYRASCAACHGKNAQGTPSMNAPRMAGMSDWYLATQLKNFKQGIRGAHDQDQFGFQMNLMAQSLVNDEEITDVVTYISSLD